MKWRSFDIFTHLITTAISLSIYLKPIHPYCADSEIYNVHISFLSFYLCVFSQATPTVPVLKIYLPQGDLILSFSLCNVFVLERSFLNVLP